MYDTDWALGNPVRSSRKELTAAPVFSL